MGYVIVGGGIAGLYAGYILVKQYAQTDITIIEKSGRLGGRIYTVGSDKYPVLGNSTIELGAGVIRPIHTTILKLINELGLSDKLILSKAPKMFVTTDKSGKIIKKSDLDETGFTRIVHELSIIKKSADFAMVQLLNSYSLFRFIEKYYGLGVARQMDDQFGYDGDFTNSNAFDGIDMLVRDSPNEKYFLSGGLKQIIDKLVNYLSDNGVRILKNTGLVDIVKYNTQYICETSNGQMKADLIILAIPPNNLKSIKFLSGISRNFDLVIPKCLFRIYLIFPVINNNVWFSDIVGSLVTPGLLRQIIPINKEKGICMIYAASEPAMTMKYLSESDILIEEIMDKINKLFPDKIIPKPTHYINKFWKYATHVWAPNSKLRSNKISQPYPGEQIYICGEAYSKVQQWIEGALLSVDDIIKLIF